MNARELMIREVVSVQPGMSLPDIARVLVESRMSAVPVVDDTGAPLGMVSEGDLIGRRNAEALSDATCTAREVMSSPLVAITENTEAHEIAHLLAGYGIQCLPVIREERIIGIVSRAAILRIVADGRFGESERIAA